MKPSTWTVARLWQALDATMAEIRPFLEHSTPERASPKAILHLGEDSTQAMLNHLAWMRDEIPKLAGDARLEKAQRWLGFIQGVAWARGMASLEALRNANHAPQQLIEFKCGDLVLCVGEGPTVFRVAKVSNGYLESTGSANLFRLDGSDHGWEDFGKLRHASPERAEIARLTQLALDYRRDGDRYWERGKREKGHSCHDKARELDEKIRRLQAEYDREEA